MIPLKPDAIAALYEFLRLLPPFTRRKLPDADDVEFFVIKDPLRYAQWQRTGRKHRISISELAVGHTATLLVYLGHEMCHMAVSLAGQDTGGNENTHNAAFRKLAARFCKLHGVDCKAFF